MNIGIDIRSLLHPVKTGVGEYASMLLSAIFSLDKTNNYFLYFNSWDEVDKNLLNWKQENIAYISTRYPNKLFNGALLLSSHPKIDHLITKNSKISCPHLDAFYSPNLNFTSLSAGTKFFLTVHDLSFVHFPEFFTFKQRCWHQLINPRKQCQKASIIFTPSENTKNDLIHTYKLPEEKIKVIYPGLSPAFTVADAELDRKKTVVRNKYSLPDHYILFLGTIEPRKNILGLIAAFERAFPKLPYPCALVIAGANGWKNGEVYRHVSQSPYREHIKIIGYIKPEEKPALYALSDLFVYPSFYEGFGFPVLEAMAMRVPVITSYRSSMPEVTGSSAYLVDPNDPGSISYGITRILASPELKKRFQDCGLGQAQKFSWQKSAADVLKSIAQ